MIEELVKKITSAEKKISEEKGDFAFFGLSERGDLENQWDVIVSAVWFSGDTQKDLVYIIEKIKQSIADDDLRLLARVVLLNPSTDFIVKKLNELINTEHEPIEKENIQVNGTMFKRLWVITSKVGA